jgi:hypothetical protein
VNEIHAEHSTGKDRKVRAKKIKKGNKFENLYCSVTL